VGGVADINMVVKVKDSFSDERPEEGIRGQQVQNSRQSHASCME
jgi:hypothetical protein